MDSEEDDEVLLEGSPLHQYLSQFGDEKCDNVCENIPNQEVNFQFSDTKEIKIDFLSKNMISEEIKNLIQILLNSGMMLDEDAHLLYLYLMKFQVYNDNIALKTLLSIGSLILAGLSNIYFDYGAVIACTGCSILAVYYTKTYLLQWYIRRCVNNLCNNLDLAYTTLKKRINFIHRLVKYFNGKQLHRARMCSKEDNGYHWAENQLSVISFQIISSLTETTIFSKKLIITLLENNEFSTKNEQSIAYMTDEQLGLDKFKEIKENSKLDLSTIEIIRHLNILMQSEFLRLIGFSFCKCTNFRQRMILLKIIKRYSKFINNYGSNTIKPLLPKENKNKTKNCHLNLIEEVQNTRLKLYSIVVELAGIEDQLSNENLSEEKTVENVKIATSIIKRETEDCNNLIHKIEKLVRRKEDSGPSEQIQINTKQPATDSVKTGIEVGKSDFSINSPDEVFLAISTKVNEEEEVDDDEFDIGSSLDNSIYSTYDNVLCEMKDVLYQKREECIKRELLALQQNPLYENFLNFQDDINKEVETSSLNIRKRKQIINEPKQEEIQNLNPNLCKEIAQKAITTSLKWNNLMSEETSFEG